MDCNLLDLSVFKDFDKNILSILDNNINFKIVTRFDENKNTIIKKFENDKESVIVLKNNNLYFLILTDFNNCYKIYEIIKEKDKNFIFQKILIMNLNDNYIITSKLHKKDSKNKYKIYTFDGMYENGEFKENNMFLYENMITDKHKCKSDNKELQRVKEYLK